jgi:two-component system response regulator HydG
MRAEIDPAVRPSGREAVLLGNSPLALELARAVERAAHARTVVVRGPAGSGRREVARALHRLATLAEGGDLACAAFVEARCAGLSGAFGAEQLLGTRTTPGLFDVARGGTLVLVATEGLEPDLQRLVAEALGRGSFTPLGARAPRRLEARVVAITTDEDLERVLVPELAYRLNDRCIAVPSLALRGGDLAEIGNELLARRGAGPLTSSAAEALAREPWIGGLGELDELLARAAERTGGSPLEAHHLDERRGALPKQAAAAGARGPAELLGDSLPLGDRSWRSVEKALIERVLSEVGGNRSRAARVLGFNRSTLYHKLAQYGLE